VLSSSNKNTKTGFTILEPLLSLALFGVIVVLIIEALLYGQNNEIVTVIESKSLYLGEEGLEAIREIRDQDFATINDGSYGLSMATGSWSLTPGSDIIENIYTRTITIQTVDVGKKEITANVSWTDGEGRSGSVSLDTYLTNWK
jgi:type II secretory pathway pseudopilin PulG